MAKKGLWTGVVLAIAVAGAGCAANPPGSGPRPSPAARRVAMATSFTLAPGERVQLGESKVAVQFRRVESDSRCPASVTCVWAGDAAVEVSVDAAGEEVTLLLHTNLEPRTASAAGIDLTLEELSPYPQSARSIAAEDYRATLRAAASAR